MIIFKFKTNKIFQKAVDLLKKAIDTFHTSHFDHSYQPEEKTISVSEKYAPVVEGWFKKHNIKYTLDRGYGRYAMAKRIASTITTPVKSVDRKIRVSEDTYDVCPHCGKEIGEKEIFYDEKGIFGKPKIWYHSVCKGPIEFPETDYTQYDETFLTPEQLKIRERQLKEPKGRIFYFRIRTFGDTDNPHDFNQCHPKCEYLTWKPDGYCNLFKKDLYSHESGIVRCPECKSAVDGLT